MNKEYCRFCLQGKTGDFLRQQQTQPSALHNVITQLADWLWSLSLSLYLLHVYYIRAAAKSKQMSALLSGIVTCDL